jgi:hypothetical protein
MTYHAQQPDEVAPLTEFQPLLLSMPAQVERFWPMVRPLLERCVKETMHGELEIDDIKVLALHGKAFIFILTNDRTGTNPEVDVRLALAVEIVQYPRLPALNVLALGGTDLALFHNKFWKQFCGWAYMNGVRAIDGWVGPAMKRMLTRFGFKQVYSHMRLELTEAHNV